jgi:small-conductance mechanosensitive channel
MDIVHLIQSAVAPVFLLSGIAGTLGVLTNRLSRVIDRARTLEERLESRPGDARHIHEQLIGLARRARYIYTAITLCAISALMVALVVMTLFANAFFTAGFAATVAVLFVSAMLFLTAAFIAFLIEVRLATASLRFGPPPERRDK